MLLASTRIGICQEPEETNATAGALQVANTITDTKGRAMEGTTLSKTETAISFIHASDQKKFEVKLGTLSEADRTFVARLVTAPVKPPRRKISRSTRSHPEQAIDLSDDDQALETGDRILSAYQIADRKNFIITEHDRSQTAIMLATEY